MRKAHSKGVQPIILVIVLILAIGLILAGVWLAGIFIPAFDSTEPNFKVWVRDGPADPFARVEIEFKSVKIFSKDTGWLELQPDAPKFLILGERTTATSWFLKGGNLPKGVYNALYFWIGEVKGEFAANNTVINFEVDVGNLTFGINRSFTIIKGGLLNLHVDFYLAETIQEIAGVWKYNPIVDIVKFHEE